MSLMLLRPLLLFSVPLAFLSFFGEAEAGRRGVKNSGRWSKKFMAFMKHDPVLIPD